MAWTEVLSIQNVMTSIATGAVKIDLTDLPKRLDQERFKLHYPGRRVFLFNSIVINVLILKIVSLSRA